MRGQRATAWYHAPVELNAAFMDAQWNMIQPGVSHSWSTRQLVGGSCYIRCCPIIYIMFC
jgi:hypothetical protein